VAARGGVQPLYCSGSCHGESESKVAERERARKSNVVESERESEVVEKELRARNLEPLEHGSVRHEAVASHRERLGGVQRNVTYILWEALRLRGLGLDGRVGVDENGEEDVEQDEERDEDVRPKVHVERPLPPRHLPRRVARARA